MTSACARTKVKDGSACELSSRSALKPPATSLSSQVASTSTKGDTTSTILESDKQDSGLDSDCREHGSQESILAPKDELLLLLEMIGERGVQLQEKVQEMEQAQASMGPGRGCAPRSHSELLEFHGKELRARLSEMEVERANYRTMVRQLQSTIHRLEGEKMAYEHKLQATLIEKKLTGKESPQPAFAIRSGRTELCAVFEGRELAHGPFSRCTKPRWPGKVEKGSEGHQVRRRQGVCT
uniref:Uncharacterized protein n=1 Tax=Ixodes ricinus TaxID=34613 RepID=A0A0K8RKP5_IXORI